MRSRRIPNRLVSLKDRPSLGQHLLVDPEVISSILGALAIRSNEQVLEIGPGEGALTSGLCSARSLTLVEFDEGFADALRTKHPSARVLREDIRQTHDDEFCGRRVVGNIPYYLSSDLLLRMANLTENAGIVDVHFMLQMEVGQRVGASPGSRKWGRLSVALQRVFETEVLFHVGAESFHPRPKVESVFVRMHPRSDSPEVLDRGAWEDVLCRAFGQRRKMLGNSLESLALDWNEVGLDPRARPESVDLDGFVAIANHCARRSLSGGA